jgi:hypothetical protein
MRPGKLAYFALLVVYAGLADVCWAGEPVVWGAPIGAKACVILREYEILDVSSLHDDTATVATSHFELSVVTSNGYSLSQTTWPDDQTTMNELQRVAITDQTRFVKVDARYSPQDLQDAQSLCRQAMTLPP